MNTALWEWLQIMRAARKSEANISSVTVAAASPKVPTQALKLFDKILRFYAAIRAMQFLGLIRSIFVFPPHQHQVTY